MQSDFKIRNRKNAILLRLLLVFIMIIELHTFGLFKWPGNINFVFHQNRAKWIAPLSVMIALFCYKKYKILLRDYKNYWSQYFLVLFPSILILWLYAYIKYPLQRLVTTYGFGCYYFYIFLTIPLLVLMEKDSGPHRILKIINVFSFIMYVVAIIEEISFLHTGHFVMELSGSESIYIIQGWVRNGRARLGIGAFGELMVLYNFYVIFNLKDRSIRRKNYLFSLLQFILGMVCVFLIEQTRMALLSVSAGIAVLIIAGDGSFRKKLVSVFALSIILIVFIKGNVFSNYVSSFSTTGSEGMSTVARMGAFSYYWKSFLKNPIFAIGFAGSDEYPTLVHGNSLIYMYNDVGIMGLIAQTGIFSIIIYIIPLIRMIYIAFRCKKSQYEPILFSIIIYLIFTSATLIITDDSRVIALPVLAALFEFINKSIKNDEKVYI